MMRVGIYNRCSTEEEAQVNALHVQAEESREIAKELGWQIAGQYIESESGTGSHRRAQYERMLEDMEADKFDIVMIKSIDRLMRSAREWYLFLDKLIRCEKRLYIYIDHKFYTPEDNLITGIKAILAEDFSRELSKKIKNAHRRRQEKKTGLNITVPMFGWDKAEGDIYQINAAEAAAYRKAFALAEAGYGFYSIAKIMDEAGIRGKKGKRISDVQWRKMLYSPRAHGTVVLHSTEYDFHTKTTRKLPPEEWILVENALPPIVSREYQEKVLRGLKNGSSTSACIEKNRPIPKRAGAHLLSGKLFCKECGAVYYRISMRSGGKKVFQWKCSTALREGRKRPEHNRGCNNKNISEKNCMQQLETLYGQGPLWENGRSGKTENPKEIFGTEEERGEAPKAAFGTEEERREASKAAFGTEEERREAPKAAFGTEEERREASKAARVMLSMVRKLLFEEEEQLSQCREQLEVLREKKCLLLEKLLAGILKDEDFQMYQEHLSGQMLEWKEKLERLSAENGKENKEKQEQRIKEQLEAGLVEKARVRLAIEEAGGFWIDEQGRIEPMEEIKPI